MITKTAADIEIRATDDDPIAPDALIGHIAPTDFPANHWVALLFDFSDDTSVEQPYRWSEPVADAELAEAAVRAHYQAAVPGMIERHAAWLADYRATATAWASPSWPN